MVRTVLAAISVSALAALTACSEGFGAADASDDNDWRGTCGVWVEQTVPMAGARDAFYRDAIEFHLSAPDATAVVVSPVDGEQWTSDDGLTIYFEPSEPLAPATLYSFALDTCNGMPEIAFETSTYGEPVDFPLKELVGTTYQLGLDSGRFMEGSELAEVAASAMGGDLLVHVLEVGPDNSTVLRVGLGDHDGQDTCARTLDLPAIDLSSAPDIRVTAKRLEIDAFSGVLPLYNVDIEATLAPDGQSLGGGRFTFTVDAVEISNGLGVGRPESLCELAAGVGVPCGPCPESDRDTCVTLAADHIVANAAQGVLVDAITELGPTCD